MRNRQEPSYFNSFHLQKEQEERTMKARKMLLNAVTMRPIQLAYDLNTITVEEMEQLVYQGYAHAVCGDRKIAVLTTPRADEDVQVH